MRFGSESDHRRFQRRMTRCCRTAPFRRWHGSLTSGRGWRASGRSAAGHPLVFCSYVARSVSASARIERRRRRNDSIWLSIFGTSLRLRFVASLDQMLIWDRASAASLGGERGGIQERVQGVQEDVCRTRSTPGASLLDRTVIRSSVWLMSDGVDWRARSTNG